MTLSPKQLEVLRRLMGGPACSPALAEQLHEDDPTGGPDWAADAVRGEIYKIRRRGIVIVTLGQGRGARGYRIADESMPLVHQLLAG